MARKPSSKPTTTTTEAEDATARVVAWLIAGLDRNQVARHLREKVSASTSDEEVDRLITQARDILADASVTTDDYERGRQLQRLDQLYALAVAQQDAKAALAVVKERTKLLNL